ncbi:MAG: hypothetical protein A2W91_04825 [Bacteroidetes bacterium GWF2_38_335]|nr:MAG: hypothetical protein A2W91_04825 [Bacteroidetes bacterium GWF2_38_335]OFY80010.1 MAG: hypothetical protein A2281_12030 [Bacteroidetes bacterium RIFOXYA12_FULL_38_20]HBS85256.1 hypothetical protein [Bacteroidales bacterium]
MRTLFQNLSPVLRLLIAICFGAGQAQAVEQGTESKTTLTILHMDSQNLTYNSEQLGNLLRIEVEKLDTFEVMDRYDVKYIVEKHKLQIDNCFGKLCLVEVGEVIKSDKMLTGSMEMYGDVIILTLRLIDVKSANIEKTVVKEFLNLPKETQAMIQISVREMFNYKNDEMLVYRLTKKFSYENSVNNPNKNTLNLSGPRMGFTYYTGKGAVRLSEPLTSGGYDASPLMFQFGYQYEKQYLNEGNYQALFEFVPLVTLINQRNFTPSLTVMNGLRNNKHGWEFAMGVTFFVNKISKGFYEEGEWYLRDEWSDTSSVENPYPIVERSDSRGDFTIMTNFLIAFGKTFKSGNLNIPVNTYIVPNKDGIRFGVSVGFNSKKEKNKNEYPDGSIPETTDKKV